MKQPHSCSLVNIVVMRSEFEILQKPEDRYRIEWIEGVRFHLRIQTLCHCSNNLRLPPAKFGLGVRQTISPIVNCCREEIVVWVGHPQLLLAVASLCPTKVVVLLRAIAPIR